MSRRVALIGAGVSGLSCAQHLAQRGAEVTLFEKSRGVGGRAATRRFEDGSTSDHGAQYFTARDPRFAQAVDQWSRMGLVAKWQGAIGSWEAGRWKATQESIDRWVGLPTMNSFCRAMSDGLNVRREIRIATAQRQPDGWWLTSETGEVAGPFDDVVSSAPAEQTCAIFADQASLHELLNPIRYATCLAAMLKLESRVDCEFDGVFVNGELISWMARDNSKPGRNAAIERWVVHGSPTWSDSRFDDRPADWLPELLQAFARVTGCELSAENAVTHRWKYSLPTVGLEQDFGWLSEQRLGVCGDAFRGARIEGAWLSGRALAERMSE